MAKIKAVYERYGFEPVETPFVEYTEALGKFLPDQDRPNEGVFSFQDEDEAWLSLRYDLTAPLARYVAENFDALPKPYRSYRAGWVFRNEKPGPGRFRQFMQFDADTVGASSPAADAEICMMAADVDGGAGFRARAIRHQGEQPEGARWRDGGDRPRRRGERRAQAHGAPGDRQVRSAGRRRRSTTSWRGRKDESGDFTKGAELSRRAQVEHRSLLSNLDFNRGDQGSTICAADGARSRLGSCASRHLSQTMANVVLQAH